MIAGKQGTVEVQHVHRVRGSVVPEADGGCGGGLFGSLRGEAGNGRLEAEPQVEQRQGPISPLLHRRESGRHLRSGLGRSGRISFSLPIFSSAKFLSLSVSLRSNSEQLRPTSPLLSPAFVPSIARRETGQFLYLDCLILPSFDVNKLSEFRRPPHVPYSHAILHVALRPPPPPPPRGRGDEDQQLIILRLPIHHPKRDASDVVLSQMLEKSQISDGGSSAAPPPPFLSDDRVGPFGVFLIFCCESRKTQIPMGTEPLVRSDPFNLREDES